MERISCVDYLRETIIDKPSRSPGPYGPWRIKTQEVVYQDPFLKVELDQVVRPDQKDGQHVVAFLKPGVCVLAIDHENHVYLTHEFHYGVGRHTLEGVSGGIEPDEDPLPTAKRELAEELGLVAETWEFQSTIDPFTSVVVSPTRLYIAKGLSEVPKAPEGTEVIESVRMPLTEAYEKVRNGEISHAPTCVLILMAAKDATVD